MAQSIRCPYCQRRLRLVDWADDQQVSCPSCQESFLSGEASPLSPESADESPRQAISTHAKPAFENFQRRPIRDALPANLRRSSPWSSLLVVFAVVGGITGCLLAGVVVLAIALRPTPPTPVVIANPIEEAERREEVRQAFANRKPLVEAELAAELQPLFQALGEAFQAGDGARAMSHFDAERMAEELAAIPGLPLEARRDPKGLARGLRFGLQQSLGAQGPLLAWVKSDIKNIKKIHDDEVVVIVRHRQQDATLKIRWWVTRRSGSWKVFDFEDLDTSISISNAVSMAANMNPNNLMQMRQVGQAIRDTSLALSRGDADTAERTLKPIDNIKLSPRLDAVRLFQHAAIHLFRGKFQDAHDTLDKAQKCHPDMPCIDLLRGMTYVRMGEWAQALKPLQAYRDLLGEDAALCEQLGLALRGVGRFAEAAATYRRGLDESPTSDELFLGLLNSLAPGDNRDDIPGRFTKVSKPRETFATACAEFVKLQDQAALAQLVPVMRKIDPGLASVDYFDALATIWSGRAQQAVGLFKAALTKEKDADERREYTLGFLKAMAKAGKAQLAYEAAPDSQEAFRYLTEQLKELSRRWELKGLVAAHAKKHPNDPLLPFYQGEVHVQDGNFLLAEKSFATGMAKPPDRLTLEQFRFARVQAGYYTGAEVLKMYKELEPREDTFSQLASLLFQDREDERLQTLLDAHAGTSPNSIELLRYRSRLKIRQGQTAEGIALFKTVLSRKKKEERNTTIAEFLRDMSRAGKPIEAYQAAPNAKSAFEILAEELLEDDDLAPLGKLIETHRKSHAEDPLVFFYLGEVHARNKAWSKAAEALEQAWNKAKADQHKRFHWRYVQALYQSGRLVHAYRTVEPPEQTFDHLANHLLHDKKGAELDRLVSAERMRRGKDARLLFLEAQAKVLLGQPARAVPLFLKANRQQTVENVRKGWLWQFARMMVEAGHGLELYRIAPDKKAAFTVVASVLLQQKKTKELMQLLAEHEKTDPGDPYRRYYRGELYLLRGDVQQAGQDYAAALSKAAPETQWMFRQGLFRARVKEGKSASAYAAAGRGQQVFEQLAQICLNDGNAGQLEALLAAHRKADPKDENTLGWEVELRWLNKDHEGVVDLLTKHRDSLFGHSRFRWKFQGYLVRSLVRLKKTQEAVTQAEALVKKNRADALLLVLAHAANGDVEQAIAALARLRPERDFRERCYKDEDLGPLVQSEAFAPFRARFPKSMEKPAQDDLDD